MAEYRDHNEIQEEVQKEAKNGVATQIAGILSALIPVLTLLGINADWFDQSFVDSVYVLLVALVPFVINVYTIIKNSYTTRKEKKQNEILKKSGYKE